MTSRETDAAWDIHSCGYHCEIPACMKAQRLELLARLDAAEAAIRKTHKVKGRHNMQIAMCEMYELLGLFCVWPDAAMKGKP